LLGLLFHFYVIFVIGYWKGKICFYVYIDWSVCGCMFRSRLPQPFVCLCVSTQVEGWQDWSIFCNLVKLFTLSI
jgi:hypothetical protein